MTQLFEGAVSVPKVTIKVALENYQEQLDGYLEQRNQAKEWLRVQPVKWYDRLLGRTNALEAAIERHSWDSLALVLDKYVEWFDIDKWPNLLDCFGCRKWTRTAPVLEALVGIQQSRGEVYVTPSQALFISTFTK
jgi:hypothetical protein